MSTGAGARWQLPPSAVPNLGGIGELPAPRHRLFLEQPAWQSCRRRSDRPVWWLAIYNRRNRDQEPGLVAVDPNFGAAFGPIPAFKAIPHMWDNGLIPKALQTSGYRLGAGLLIAIAIGVPIGIIMGRNKRFRELSNSPFQLMRMISPLSWEPIAVIVFAGWDSGDHLPDRHRRGLADHVFHRGGPFEGRPGLVQGGAKPRCQAMA
jgi:hypothetical protein